LALPGSIRPFWRYLTDEVKEPIWAEFQWKNNKQSEVQQAHQICLFIIGFTYLFTADQAVMKGKSSKNRGGKEAVL
jgi:hypothetical protein